MTQYQITLSDKIVHGLFKEDGAMARLVEQVLNQVLEAEVTETLQAKPYEGTEKRQGYRNGFKPRTMTTRVGRLVLSVPYGTGSFRLNFSPDFEGASRP